MSGRIQNKMSSDFPTYEGPPCRASTLPFRCKVRFYVDSGLTPRPAPFTPPGASVAFQFQGKTLAKHEDPRIQYKGAGSKMGTTLPEKYDFSFSKNGPLHMKFELQDPDTAFTRVYEDTIQILAIRPCDLPARPERDWAYA